MVHTNKKYIVFSLLTILIFSFLILLGPVGFFRHGYYANEIEVKSLSKNDLTGEYDLEAGDYETVFTPNSKYMTGFEVYLKNVQENEHGELQFKITDNNGTVIDSETVELSKVKSDSWYKIYTHAKFKTGNQYTLTISAENCGVCPHLQLVTSAHISNEIISGNALVSIAYKKPTFTVGNKILIGFFAISLWLIVLSMILGKDQKKYVKTIGFCGILVVILSWNYFYNSIDNKNSDYALFQIDSETLNTGVVYANKAGSYYSPDNVLEYGLGRYININGDYYGFANQYLSDDDWINGFSKNKSAVIISNNAYSSKVAVIGNKLKFSNGEIFEITNVTNDGKNIDIQLNGGILSEEKNGSLNSAIFLDGEGNELPKGYLSPYVSQYGLQGKVFRMAYGLLHNSEGVIRLSQLACTMLLSITVISICFMIWKKYNLLLATCFFATFWLSSWVVNFARNLYWVEFTWFIPMAVGLFCAWKLEKRRYRIISYILAFISILIKCLCGYEYISTIMMGLITFLLVDFVSAIAAKDKQKVKQLSITILTIGTCALLGFIVAMCMHAQLRGNGEILKGIEIIFKNDVLRRTSGANLNDFYDNLWPSMNASVWEVVCKYFHFSTEIITGIPGSLFIVMVIIPIMVFVHDYSVKSIRIENVALYIITFITSISWLVLAKSHSYIHTHISYVLWYFGFVQVCFYIILNKFIEVIGKLRMEKSK